MGDLSDICWKPRCSTRVLHTVGINLASFSLCDLWELLSSLAVSPSLLEHHRVHGLLGVQQWTQASVQSSLIFSAPSCRFQPPQPLGFPTLSPHLSKFTTPCLGLLFTLCSKCAFEFRNSSHLSHSLRSQPSSVSSSLSSLENSPVPVTRKKSLLLLLTTLTNGSWAKFAELSWSMRVSPGRRGDASSGHSVIASHRFPCWSILSNSDLFGASQEKKV